MTDLNKLAPDALFELALVAYAKALAADFEHDETEDDPDVRPSYVWTAVCETVEERVGDLLDEYQGDVGYAGAERN